jgi:alkylation response protein AidB-like acyl-CoA dehydrogenase
MELLLTEDERMLKAAAREFADRELAPNAQRLDETEEFPRENLRGIANLGFMGLTVDQAYGGGGGSYQQLSVVIEELARGCAATSVAHLAHLSLATSSIAVFGSEEQKRRYLPDLASGKRLAAFCLTEPGSGSDAADMSTLATRINGGYQINGAKTFITNGPEADVLVVFASTDRPQRARGVSAFIVQGDAPGLLVNPQKGKMGMRASSTAELAFTDCPIPEEDRLGQEGDGFTIAMTVLDSSRISVAAQAVGIGQAAFEAAVRYSQQRQTFGKRLADHQAIQFMLADMATQLSAARLLTRHAAQLKDAHLPHGQESAMAKVFASEAAHFACDRALQIHGGSGYFKDNPVERYFRDARVTEIYEGSSEVQRIVIARKLLKEMAV